MNPKTLDLLGKLAAHRLDQERLRLAAARDAEQRQQARWSEQVDLLRRAADLRPSYLGFGAWRAHGVFLAETDAKARAEWVSLTDRTREVAGRVGTTLEALQARDIVARLAERAAERIEARRLAAERREQDEFGTYRARISEPHTARP